MTGKQVDINEMLFGADRPLGILKPLLCDLSRIIFKGFNPAQDPYDTTGHTEFACEDVAGLYRDPSSFCSWIKAREEDEQMVVICSRVGTRALEVLPMLDLEGRLSEEALRTMMLRLATMYRSPVHAFDSGASYHIYIEKLLSDEHQHRGSQSALAEFLGAGQMTFVLDGKSYLDPSWVPHQIRRNGFGGLRINQKNGTYPRYVSTVRPAVAPIDVRFSSSFGLDERISWIARVLEPFGCRSVIMHGGALSPSSFQIDIDDIDLTIVYDRSTSISFDSLIELSEQLEPFGYDIGLISYETLQNASLNLYEVSARASRTMHPIEVHILKEASKVIIGQDVRNVVNALPWREAVDRSLQFRLEKIDRMRFEAPLDPERLLEMRRYLYALVRDVSALRVNHGLPKRIAITQFLDGKAQSDAERGLQAHIKQIELSSQGSALTGSDFLEMIVEALKVLSEFYQREGSRLATLLTNAVSKLNDQRGGV